MPNISNFAKKKHQESANKLPIDQKMTPKPFLLYFCALIFFKHHFLLEKNSKFIERSHVLQFSACFKVFWKKRQLKFIFQKAPI